VDLKRLALTLALLLLVSQAHAQNYSASSTALVAAAAATDLWVISAASKTITVSKVVVSCTQTTSGIVDVVFLRRSTLDTLGTSTAPTVVKHTTGNPTSIATVAAYTANPTVGTLVGNIGVYKLSCLAPATATPADIIVENFRASAQPPTFTGTEQFVINLNAQTISGSQFDIRVEWEEH
jgi:hypothetical protein